MKKEAGFTLIEVMIAILLASVTLSGLLYLISSTAILTSQAKVSKEAAALAAKEAERLRNLDFDAIGFPDATGNEPYGILQRELTTQTALTTYELRYEIEWINDPNTTNETHDYKKVRIIVSWKKPRPGRYYLVTYISQASRRAPGRIIVPPPPELIVPPSPPAYSVVRGSIPIVVRIDEPTMLFSALEIRIGNNLAGQKVNIQPPSSSKEITYYWDTTLFEDGRYEITALAYEARGGTSYRNWYYYVDNSPPNESPQLNLVSVGVNDAVLSWTTIKDGYETVQTYEFRLYDYYRNESIVTTITLGPSESNLNEVTRTLSVLSPWGFYSISTRGFSYGSYGPSSNAVEARTKLELTYVVSISGANANITLNWTRKPAQVDVSKYQVWRRTNTQDVLIAEIFNPLQSSYSFTVRKHSLPLVLKVKAFFNYSGNNYVNESDYVVVK
mgnify:CR=1 FL=1